MMSVIKIDDIKDQVEELVSRVQAGETILIEKDGKTVARLEGIAEQFAAVDAEQGPKSKRKIDITALQEFTRSLPLQEEPSDVFIRRMRDEARY